MRTIVVCLLFALSNSIMASNLTISYYHKRPSSPRTKQIQAVYTNRIIGSKVQVSQLKLGQWKGTKAALLPTDTQHLQSFTHNVKGQAIDSSLVLEQRNHTFIPKQNRSETLLLIAP